MLEVHERQTLFFGYDPCVHVFAWGRKLTSPANVAPSALAMSRRKAALFLAPRRACP